MCLKQGSLDCDTHFLTPTHQQRIEHRMYNVFAERFINRRLQCTFLAHLDFSFSDLTYFTYFGEIKSEGSNMEFYPLYLVVYMFDGYIINCHNSFCEVKFDANI
jgi:hypothetical protein